jgi:hypothetical protein
MNTETFVATLAEILGVPPQQDIRTAILERAAMLREHMPDADGVVKGCGYVHD